MHQNTISSSSFAFSLIELMVVISIIGVLAAIAAPSYRLYMVRSRIAAGIPIIEAYIEKSIDYANIHGHFPTGQELGVLNPNYSSIPSTLPPYTAQWGGVQGDTCGKVQEIVMYWDASKVGLTPGDIALGNWQTYYINGNYQTICAFLEGAYGWAGPWSSNRYISNCYNGGGGDGGDEIAEYNAAQAALSAAATCPP
jgi:prepilin-type N-terminal cleavage/methylation domain-containing protein